MYYIQLDPNMPARAWRPWWHRALFFWRQSPRVVVLRHNVLRTNPVNAEAVRAMCDARRWPYTDLGVPTRLRVVQ